VTASNPFSLDGKVAIITGGGRGIGAGIAKSMAEAGASVVLVSRTKEQIDATAAEITADGGSVLGLPTDVTDFSQHDGVIAAAVDTFGGLDIVVNCAGGGDMWKAFLDEDVEDIQEAFRFNVAVPFELVKKATPRLLERPGASVINIVSGAIYLATRGHLSYDASKGALHFATLSMAASLGPKIRVNGINPGIIQTEAMKAVVADRPGILEALNGKVRMRRLGEPEDIGRTAVFLASPAASYITGQVITVDGGPVGEMAGQFPDL